jgi:hypothetical protein
LPQLSPFFGHPQGYKVRKSNLSFFLHAHFKFNFYFSFPFFLSNWFNFIIFFHFFVHSIFDKRARTFQMWLIFFNFHSTGDSIFTAGKPAILSNNTLIRGSKALNNSRRPITSSSSTISSQSTNNDMKDHKKDRSSNKDGGMHSRYVIDSGKSHSLSLQKYVTSCYCIHTSSYLSLSFTF